MEQMYNVSSNPHIRDKMTTSRIMQLVVIALLPATFFGILEFWCTCASCNSGNCCIQCVF